MSARDAIVYRALTRLLGDLFGSASSLAGFLRGISGRTIVDDLPAETVPLNVYVAAAVVVLQNHGAIDPALFRALADARPAKYAAIVEAANLCEVVAPTEPPRRGHSQPRMRAARALGRIVTSRLMSRASEARQRAGREPLEWLAPGTLLPPRQDNPASLLNARYGLVPFHTWLRAGELDALRTWCERDDPVAVSVVAGPGGVGKTRLMLELCEQARAAGFVAGFVPPHVSYEDFAGLFAPDAKFLAVVDYAETRPTIGVWLTRAASIAPYPGQRTRVVLVVRSLADWWDALLGRSTAELHGLLRRDEPIVLSPGSVDQNARGRVYNDAAAHFARLRGVSLPTDGSPDLGASRFGRVLYLHMAALAAVDGRPAAIGSLLADTLRHEREFWSRQLPEIVCETDRELTRVQREIDLGVAAISLAGGTNNAERALGLFARARVGEPLRDPLLARLGDLYPGTAEAATGHAYLSPLEPDLLAEAHVAAVLLSRTTPADLVRRLFIDEQPEEVRTPLHLLGRLASDPPVLIEEPRDRLDRALRASLSDLLAADLAGRAPVALEVATALAERQLRCPLAEVLADALRRGGTPALAEVLARQPFSNAVALRPVAEWTLRTTLDTDGATDHQQRFVTLVQFAAIKLGQEDRDEAHALLRQAVESSQAWVQEEPAALWPSALGIGLLGLADGEVGEHEASVERARDSLRCFEALIAATPGDDFEALSLILHMMYGLALLRNGSRVEAVGVFKAMEPRYVRLAAERPGVQIPEQALCDFYLGLCLGEAGHHTEAVVVLRRAVAAQRGLVERQRGSRLIDLAWSLMFLCEAEERLGENEAALAVGRESVGLWEELTDVDRDAGTPGLALALCAVASVMNTVGDNDDARVAALRGVELWRVLADQRPLVFTPPLVAALSILGSVLSEPGDGPAALEALDEALALARPLAARSPGAFGPLLGRCLLLQGLRHTQIGDDAAAAAALREGVATFRALPDDGAVAFTLEWGLAADLLAAIHGDRDEYVDVVELLSEVLAVMQRAPDEAGPLHGFVRGTAHMMRAMAFMALEDYDAAIAGFLASLSPLRAAKNIHADAAGSLGFVLTAVAAHALDHDDLAGGEAALLEAIPIFRSCIDAGERYTDELAEALVDLARIHHGRDAKDSARDLLLEAERRLRGLPADELHDQRDTLADCVAMLSDLEKDPDRRMGRLREAASLAAGLFAECEDDPDEHLDRLTEIAEAIAELGDLDEGARLIEAAVVRARHFLSDHVDDLLLSLTDALEALVDIHVEREAPGAVLKALREAADLWRVRATRLLPEHRTRFAELLQDLGEALTELGEPGEARRVFAERRALRVRGPT